LASELPKIILENKDDLSCFESANASIEISGYDGLPPYAYRLNDGAFQDSPTFNNLGAGRHILEIKDANGNVSKRPVFINSPDPIEGIIEVLDVTCQNEIDATIAVEFNGGNPSNRTISLSNDSLTYSLNQEGFSEDFENGSPTNWTLQRNWRYGTSEELSGAGFDIPPSGSCIALNDARIENNSGASSVYSKVIDLENATSATVSFDAFFLDSDWFTDETAKFYISSDNGSSYQEIISLPRFTDWYTYKFYFENLTTSKLKLRFEYNDGRGWNYGLAIDNVKVFNNAKVYFEGLGKGDYTLEISDEEGCSTIQTFSLASQDLIEVQSLTYTEPTCDSSGSISMEAFSINGIAFYSLEDQTNSSGSFDNLDAGFYQITITDNNGCTRTEEVELSPWSLDLSQTETICSSYPNTYYQTEICTDTGEIVNWNLRINDQLTFFSSDSSSCYSLDLSDYILDFSLEDIFLVEAIDEYGCSKSIEISLQKPIKLLYNAEDTIYLCSDTSEFELVLENINDFELVTVNDSSDNLIMPQFEGTYSLDNEGRYLINGIDLNGCTYKSDLTIIKLENLLIEIIEQNPANSVEGGSVTIGATGGSGFYEYSLLDETNDSGTFSDISPGTYEIIVTDMYDCTSTIEITINFASSIIPENSLGRVKAHPNPTHDFVTLKTDFEILESDVKLYYTNLQEVSNFKFLTEEKKLDLTYLPSGLYFIHLKNENIDLVLKQVKF